MDGSKSFDPNAGGKMKHSTYWFLYINTDEKYFENLRESLKLYQIVIPPSIFWIVTYPKTSFIS